MVYILVFVTFQQDNREKQTIFKWEEEIQYGPQKGKIMHVFLNAKQHMVNLS